MGDEYLFQVTLLSPAFLGGATQKPEIRTASLRGVLRYWYRALYGEGSEDSPTRLERRLFGDTSRRGAVKIQWSNGGAAVRTCEHTKVFGNQPPRRGYLDGLRYAWFSAGMQARDAIAPGPGGSLRLSLHPAPDETLQDELKKRALLTLAVASYLGGFGLRSRRAAGAWELALRSGDLPDGFSQAFAESRPETPEALLETIRTLLKRSAATSDGRPWYPVFASGYFEVGVAKRTFDDWRQAVRFLGEKLGTFRKGKDRIARAAFGMPILFRGRTRGTLQPENEHRRASPIHFTLNSLRDGKLALTWTFFAARLTPTGKVQLATSRHPEPDYSLVKEFLSRELDGEFSSHRLGGGAL